LSKLEHYGFRGTSNLWFKNCGEQQESILGPILIILVNDLPKTSKFFTILFVDDTTLQLSSESLHDLHDLANFELSKLEDWFKANKLTLIASKTKYILFKNKNRRYKYHLS